MDEDPMDRVKRGEAYLQPLYDRMDDDAELVRLEAYSLTDAAGNPVPNSISVTPNEPAVFANSVVAMIQETIWQASVEGDITAERERAIESFIYENLYRADTRLVRMGQPKMFPFLSNHIALRGWIGARWVSRMEGDSYIPDCMPLDMRYFSYERTSEGLLWGAYRTRRPVAAIEAEYGFLPDTTDPMVDVVDYWDDTRECVYIKDELVLEQKHPFGAPPFVIQAAPAGFMFRDDEHIEFEGESIFMLNRGLYDEYSRLVSIDQTLAMHAVMPSYQKRYIEDMPEDQTPYPQGIGRVADVKAGEEYDLIQRPDINNASRTAHNNMSGALQRGGVNNLDLGNVTFPTSAVWISEQTDIRNKLVSPRMNALGAFYENLSRLMLEQVALGGFKGKLDMKKYGRPMSFDVNKFGDPWEYDIKFRMMSRNRKQEVANITVAASARGLMSRETIVRDILNCEDPEAEINRLDNELAEEAEPALKLFRMAYSLADEAAQLDDIDPQKADRKRLESMLLTTRAEKMYIMAGQQLDAATAQGGQQKPQQSPSPVPMNPQRNEPKKGPDNGALHGRPDGGRAPKMPLDRSMEGLLGGEKE